MAKSFKKSSKPKINVREVVTNQIIAALENGVKPWVCPWDRGGVGELPQNFETGNDYKGMNIMLLWSSAIENGYRSKYWMTYKQAKNAGGYVKAKEKGTMIIFYKQIAVKDKLTDEEKIVPMLAHHYVYNAEQIEGVDFPSEERAEVVNTFETMANVEQLISNTGANIEEVGAEACYIPSKDKILLPTRDRFTESCDFYATSLHELTHWTGHKSRLDRDIKNKFGSKDYAFEELVAELGNAFLCAELGIKGEVQHEEYIAAWLKKLNDDNTFIFKAASAASKAHQFIMDFGTASPLAKTA